MEPVFPRSQTREPGPADPSRLRSEGTLGMTDFVTRGAVLALSERATRDPLIEA